MRINCIQCGNALDVEFESSQDICMSCQRESEGPDISQLEVEDDDLYYNPDEERCDRCGIYKGVELAAPKWIPVTERLPEDAYEGVLVSMQLPNNELHVCIGSYYGDRWTDENNEPLEIRSGIWKVLAWMPLPESYQP